MSSLGILVLSWWISSHTELPTSFFEQPFFFINFCSVSGCSSNYIFLSTRYIFSPLQILNRNSHLSKLLRFLLLLSLVFCAKKEIIHICSMTEIYLVLLISNSPNVLLFRAGSLENLELNSSLQIIYLLTTDKFFYHLNSNIKYIIHAYSRLSYFSLIPTLPLINMPTIFFHYTFEYVVYRHSSILYLGDEPTMIDLFLTFCHLPFGA